ncbi:hypothetical protein HK405_008681 [Cladochytrium tenue]|nr:hypothetical protein HK405_008681 [Cladochytrium tenue]
MPRRPSSRGSRETVSLADSFAALSLVSRRLGPPSDSPDDENRKVQESLYQHVKDKLQKLEDQSGGQAPLDYDPILAGFLYEHSAHVCLRAGNFPELLKSLSTLVGVIYPAISNASPAAPLPKRAEFTALYLLYFICYTTGPSVHRTSFGGSRPLPPPQTAPQARGIRTSILSSQVRGNAREVLRVYSQLPDSLQSDGAIRLALAIQRALLVDVDYYSFARCWAALDERQRLIVKVRDAYESKFLLIS